MKNTPIAIRALVVAAIMLLMAFASSASATTSRDIPTNCPTRTGHSAVLIIEDWVRVQPGDVLYAVQRGTNRCAGVQTMDSDGSALTIWGDDDYTEDVIEGMEYLKPIDLVVYRDSQLVRTIYAGWPWTPNTLYFASYVDDLNLLADSLDQELAQMDSLLNQLEAEGTAYLAELAEKEATIVALQTELAYSADSLADARRIAANAEQLLYAAQVELGEVQEAYAAAQANLAAAIDERDALQVVADNLTAQNAALQGDLAAAEALYAEQSARADLAEAEAAKWLALSDSRGAQLDAAEAEIAGLQTRATEAEEALAPAIARAEEAEAALAPTLARAEEAERIMAQQAEQLNAVAETLRGQNSRLARLLQAIINAR